MFGAFPVLRSEVVTLSPPLPDPEPPIPASQYFYYWNLNETEEYPLNWYDSYSNRPLSGNAVGSYRVSSVPDGKIGRCAKVSTQNGLALNLSIGYNVISWNQSNSINLWFRLATPPPSTDLSWSFIFTSDNYSPFSLGVSTTALTLYCGMAGGITRTITLPWEYDLNWHMITMIYTDSPRQVAIGLDMNEMVSVDLPAALYNPSAGAIYFGGYVNQYSLEGYVDLIGIFPYALNAGQRSFLWNAGAGREYPW